MGVTTTSRNMLNASVSQTANVQNTVLAAVLAYLRANPATLTTIDNVPIGQQIPSTGRFRELTVGSAGLGYPVNFYGAGSYVCNWNPDTGTLTIPNLAVTGGLVMSKDLTWPTQQLGAITLRVDPLLGTMQISDPIPQVGSSLLPSDNGLFLPASNNQTAFIGMIDGVLRCVTNPIVTQRTTTKAKEVSGTNAPVALGQTTVDQLVLPWQRIYVDDMNYLTQVVDVTKTVIYLVVLGIKPLSDHISLPSGSMDGQQLTITLTSTTKPPEYGLVITGMFLMVNGRVPSISLERLGSGIEVVWDTYNAAWLLRGGGSYN